MSVKDTLLPEFDQEMAATRLVLERVPVPALAWRPHEGARDLGALASHVAQIPFWGQAILQQDAYNMDAAESVAPAASVAAVLERFDRHVAAVRRTLTDMADGQLLAPWALRRGGRLILSMPKIAALRSFVLHHIIHHRGQLTVYLRMQGVVVPPLYGQTAAEPA